MEAKGNTVFLIPDPKETETKAGLFIPDGAEEKTVTGEVVFVGTRNAFNEPIPVKPGDRILYVKHAGFEVTIKEQKYLCIKSEDIVFVL